MAFLMISLDPRDELLNQCYKNQRGQYTFIKKITSFHFTLSGNFVSNIKRVSKQTAGGEKNGQVTLLWSDKAF